MILFNSAIEDEVKDERSPLKQNNGSPTKDSPVKATRKGRRCRVIESDDEEEGTKETQQENQSNSTDPVKVYYISANPWYIGSDIPKKQIDLSHIKIENG